MYSIFISIIAFLLLSFEVGTGIIFSKDLDSNILVLALIMILPGVLFLVRHDVDRYHILKRGRLQGKVFERKRLTFLLEILFQYSIVAIASGLLILGLLTLLGNITAISYALIFVLFFLAVGSVALILRGLHS